MTSAETPATPPEKTLSFLVRRPRIRDIAHARVGPTRERRCGVTTGEDTGAVTAAILPVAEEAGRVQIEGDTGTLSLAAKLGRRGIPGGVTVDGHWVYDEETDEYTWAAVVRVTTAGILLQPGDRVVMLFQGDKKPGVEIDVVPLPGSRTDFRVVGRGYPPFLDPATPPKPLPAPSPRLVADGFEAFSVGFLDPDDQQRRELLGHLRSAWQAVHVPKGHAVVRNPSRHCAACAAPYEAVQDSQRFCSPRCRLASYQKGAMSRAARTLGRLGGAATARRRNVD